MTMTNGLFKCAIYTSANGDEGLARLDHIPGLDEKIYRFNETVGGMEYAIKRDFDAMGWAARTYWTLLDPSRFHIVNA